MKCSTCPADCYADAVIIGDRTLCRACADLRNVLADALMADGAVEFDAFDLLVDRHHARAVALRAKPEAGGATWKEAAKLRADLETARGDVLRLERRVGEQAEIVLATTRIRDAKNEVIVALEAMTVRAEKAEAEVARLVEERQQRDAFRSYLLENATIEERRKGSWSDADETAWVEAQDTRYREMGEANQESIRKAEALQHAIEALRGRADAAERTVAALVDGLRFVTHDLRTAADDLNQYSEYAGGIGRAEALLADPVAAGAAERWVPGEDFDNVRRIFEAETVKRDAANARIAVLENLCRTVRRLADKEIVGSGEHSVSMLGSIVAMCDINDLAAEESLAKAEASRAHAARLRALIAKEQP
jgi:hypothetical protein